MIELVVRERFERGSATWGISISLITLTRRCPMNL